MMSVQTIELNEYKPKKFEPEEIQEAIAETLWLHYSTQVDVDFPSPKTGRKWKLTSKGWVGHIPLTPEFHIALRPKVPIANIFGMLEYAYNLKSFDFLKGLIDCQTLEEFYSQLAHLLAKRIIDRCRKGFYRAYLPKTGNLPYIRGRLDVPQAVQKPWNVQLKCHYQEHTADIEDNQILAWTLFIIVRSGLCPERVRSPIRKAYRALHGFVTLQPFKPQDCIGRHYNRLNEDYQILHALCRFFLEHTGPNHEKGDRSILPFLVDMAKLYELFVAEWLKAHLPDDFDIKAQERIDISSDKTLHFKLDLVLYHRTTGAARYVLDTKYKTTLVSDDVQQVVAYAVSKGCRQAVLVSPNVLTRPLDECVGDIQVRSLTFSLDGNLEQAGETFLQDLLRLC